MPDIDDNNAESVDGAEDAQTGTMPRPVVTYGFIAVCLVVFYVMNTVGNGNIDNDVVTRFGGKVNFLISEGQRWRFVTPIFLHGGWTHVAVNCYSLYLLGGSMERIYGSRKYFIVLIIAGIAGNVVSFFHSTVPSLGASGSIAGLVGAGLVFPMRYRKLIRPEARHQILRQLLTVLIINGAIGFQLRSMIDNWAHMGGLVGGGAVALFLIPDVLEIEPRRRSADIALWAVSTALLGLVFASAFMQYRWALESPHDLKVAGIEIRFSLPKTWREERDANGKPFWSGPKAEHLYIEETGNANFVALINRMKGSNAPTVQMGGYTALQLNHESPGHYAIDSTYVVAVGDKVLLVSFTYPASAASEVSWVAPHFVKGFRLEQMPSSAASNGANQNAAPQ